MKRAVFLDRDGVIVAADVRDGRPFTADEPMIIDEVPAALDRLRDFTLVVITNQPDVARGTQTRAALDAIHATLRAALPQLDAIYVCPHDDADHCACRKPAPGLLRDAARDLDLDLPASFLVGDRWRDIDAGTAAGCRTIFLDREYAERRPTNYDTRVTSLAEAVTWILNSSK